MERLNEQLNVAHKTLSAFKEILDEPKNDITRDAAIKRFEFTFEAIWKLIRIYLREKEGVDVGSPKSTFRECLKVNLLDEEKTNLALQMVDHRNLTVHTYNEELIDIIYAELNRYQELLEILVGKIKEKGSGTKI